MQQLRGDYEPKLVGEMSSKMQKPEWAQGLFSGFNADAVQKKWEDGMNSFKNSGDYSKVLQQIQENAGNQGLDSFGQGFKGFGNPFSTEAASEYANQFKGFRNPFSTEAASEYANQFKGFRNPFSTEAASEFANQFKGFKNPFSTDATTEYLKNAAAQFENQGWNKAAEEWRNKAAENFAGFGDRFKASRGPPRDHAERVKAVWAEKAPAFNVNSLPSLEEVIAEKRAM